MGYTTDFYGEFKLNKPLDLETFNFLKNFSEERHEDGDVPGIWCQWIPTNDKEGIEWDGNEKFYEYIEWLKYLIKNFLSPKGYVLNGEVEWDGEERGDTGKIIVKDNIVETKKGKIIYE